MSKGRTIQRISNKKRGRPRVRFNFWFMVILFMVAFVVCFVLYMVAANINDNFFGDEFNVTVAESDTAPTADQQPTGSGAEDTDTSAAKPKVANPIASSPAADASYLDSCLLVTDRTLLGMKSTSTFKNIIGSDTLNAVNCNTERVETTSGVVTISEAVGLIKPLNVYIMLGSDIGSSSTEEMIASYVSLISSLRNAAPDANIYVMEYPPVLGITDSVNNETINSYNSELLSMADRLDVYYISTGLDLKSATGDLDEQYWSAETGSLNSAAYDLIKGYVLTHTV